MAPDTGARAHVLSPARTAPSSHRLGISCPLSGVTPLGKGLSTPLEAASAVSGPPWAHVGQKMGQGDGFFMTPGLTHLQATHTPGGMAKEGHEGPAGPPPPPILIITWNPAPFRPGGLSWGGLLWLCPSLCLSHPTPCTILLPEAAMAWAVYKTVHTSEERKPTARVQPWRCRQGDSGLGAGAGIFHSSQVIPSGGARGANP